MQEKDCFPHFTDLVVKTACKIATESQVKLNLKQVRAPALRIYPRTSLTLDA